MTMLTGETRYRTTWNGKLILQVEYAVDHTMDLNGSGYYDQWTTKHWRDARLSDFPNILREGE